MRKIIVMFLAICIFTGPGYFLMPQEFQEIEIAKTPTFKEVGGFSYVYMDFTCLKGKARESVRVFMDECKKQGIQSEWIFEIFYVWSENDADEIKWAMAYIVPGNTKFSAPLKMAKIEKFNAAFLTYTGPLDPALVKSWNVLLDNFLIDNGLTKTMPIYEIIRLNPPRLDIIYPVKK
ncbi:MAG TPA: hypothetical protein VK469_05525 [Candidatus Kapabacteria bacterium]|nr:hypothetical protein [Candidatus Kapabacteria bacterium]